MDAILSVGRSLESLGIRNWALGSDAALFALESLSDLGIGVLGGDVYVVDGGGVESNYDNWYCNKERGESSDDFVARSISKAKSYILGYQRKGVLFALVPDIDNSGAGSLPDHP